MWKRDEAVKPTTSGQATSTGPTVQSSQSSSSTSQPEPRQQTGRDVVNIGKSVVIKGELNGSEDLTIEGQVEGKIELKDHVLTIGPNGKIKAQVFAKALIVLGEVNGNVTATDKVEIRRRFGRWRHHRAAGGHCRRGAFPGQRRHAASRRATRSRAQQPQRSGASVAQQVPAAQVAQPAAR